MSMFSGCSNLESVTILTTSQSLDYLYFLADAGTNAVNPTIFVANSDIRDWMLADPNLSGNGWNIEIYQDANNSNL